MKVTQYVQSALFLTLGFRATTTWLRNREPRQGHLSIATMLFGAGQLISAVNVTIYDAAKGETPPRAVTVASGILVFLAMYGFVLFLSDFITFPRWAHGLAVATTAFNVVLVIIERPDRRIVGSPPRLEHVPGVDNPISYAVFVQYALAYLAVVFGLLWVAFLVYGLRNRGVARFRMLSITAGFFVLFVAVGLIPRLLFGRPASDTIRTIQDVVRYLALASAPLLLVGFAPPKWITRRFAAEPHQVIG